MRLDLLACHTRLHCETCRTNADWRESVTGVREFECPHGIGTEGGELVFPHIRNLLYYVCPFTLMDFEWRNNIQVLKRYMQVFNGKRIIMVAQGDGLAPIEEVKTAFGYGEFQFVPVKNNAELGEVVPFMLGLRFLKSTRPNEYTFYAHAKGVSPKYEKRTEMLHNIRMWRTVMYHMNLRNPKDVDQKLQDYYAYGCFKAGNGFNNIVEWHYAGTFFWFRHDKVFVNPNWDKIRMIRHGVEIYLSELFDKDKAYNVFPNQPFPELYRPTKHAWLQILRTTDLSYAKAEQLTKLKKGDPVIDVVIPYVAANNDEQLRCAIRSIHTFFPQLNRLIVVGDRPFWFRGEYIPSNAETIEGKVKDVLPHVSDNFVVWLPNLFLMRESIFDDFANQTGLPSGFNKSEELNLRIELTGSIHSVSKNLHFTQIQNDIGSSQILHAKEWNRGIKNFLFKHFPNQCESEIENATRQRPTLSQVKSLTKALLTAKEVSLEVMQERLETCFKCKHVKSDGKTKFCGLCGCAVSSNENKIANLARYEENLPEWGCKHPERHNGYGWKN